MRIVQTNYDAGILRRRLCFFTSVLGFFISSVAGIYGADCYTVSPGCLDPTFGVMGKVVTDTDGQLRYDWDLDSAKALTIQSDGKIVAVGQTSNPTMAPPEDDRHFAVVRYHPDGSLDLNFGSGGKVTTDFLGDTDSGQGVAIQPSDNKIVVAGYACAPGWTQEYFALARYNADGSLDTDFCSGGKVTTAFSGAPEDFGYALALQPDQKIVAGGTAKANGTYNFALARYFQ